MNEPHESRYATAGLCRAATRLLARETGDGPANAKSLATASGRLLDTLSQRLADVIGPAGVSAIVHRAVRLHQPQLRFLDERIFRGDNRDTLAEGLRACLQAHEPEVIRDVWVTLFATVTGLLANVIGDRLTWSLLEQIWPDTIVPGSELQESQE